MKTVASMMIIGGLAAAAGVHAQDAMGMDDTTMGGTAYETMTTSSTQTVDGTTTNVQTQYVSTTSVVPATNIPGGVIGDAPATPALTADSSVQVKMPDGTMLTIPDSADAPWNKDSRLSGYDRFTFDADTGAFVAGKGDDKFAGNWDENGNRVAKPAPKAPKPVVKKVKAKKVVVKTTPAVEATDAAPAEPEAAADAVMPSSTGETVTETVSQTTVETPTKKTTSTVTVTSTSTPATDNE